VASNPQSGAALSVWWGQLTATSAPPAT